MKTIQINILLFLLVLTSNTFSQLIYIGLGNEKLSNIGNPLIKSKQDTLFVPTKNGLFKKSFISNDTLWYTAGFQGMIINDYVFIGQDTIICVVDSTEGNTVFISTNNGSTYSNATNGFGGTGINFGQGSRIDVNPNNHNEIIAMSGMCVARSSNFCGSWTPVYLNWGYTSYQSTVLRYHPKVSNLIYSGGEINLFDSYIAYTFDAGTNWATSAVESNNAVNCIAFHPTNNDTIIIGKEGKIVRSIDKGVNWSDVYNTPNYEYIYSIVYDNFNSNILYAVGAINGTNDTLRIFRSLDGGSNWEIWVEDIFPNSDKQMISMIMLNNNLYILTRDHFSNSQGVFKLNVSNTLVSEVTYNNQINIFPNPATDILTIEYTDNNRQEQVQIFNSIGALIKEIDIIKSFNINIADLSNGLYVIRLKNQLLQSRKFIKQ